MLGSHEFPTPPSTEMNAVPTVAGEGVFKDVVQVPFPAGSGILYDSRTYHRAPPELNVSGEERWAMLTCIVRSSAHFSRPSSRLPTFPLNNVRAQVPSFVRDLRARDDKIDSANAFAQATAVHKALTPREAHDVVKMLCDDDAGAPRADVEAAVAASRQQAAL